MDPQLKNIFDEYDILEDDPAEEAYQTKAAFVADNFVTKMETAGNKLRFAQDLVALFRYFMDNGVQWYRKTIVVAALAYFIFPLDAMPDLMPLVGYLDDLGVVAAVIKFLGHELTPYYPS